MEIVSILGANRCASSSLKKITGVGDVCTSVGDQEKVLCMLLYRDQSTGALGQSTGGCPGVLCRFSAGISRLMVPISRLMAIPRVEAVD